ncbi:MAG: NAD(P)/FAD-dependent oxidoreductase [Chloroflexaceae bacterium]|nr:NAD(P)/FAD-dependent oxidoreductase [Chloroflexaceae bacterium]
MLLVNNDVTGQPNTPIKCGGAPQKIAYLAEDYFRKSGVRERSSVIFASAAGGMFGIKKYADSLNAVIARKGMDARYQHDLVEVRPNTREAVFTRLDDQSQVVLHYDMLHVTPPMSAPDVIKQSILGHEAGWVDVDKHTLRHNCYNNIFSLGDCSSLPTSKTGAAIRKQAPVLVENMMALMHGKAMPATYDGYTSCPLVTGY